MKNIALFIIGLICAVSPASAEDAKPVQENKLGMQLDVMWVGKYIWRIQDLYDDHAAFQPSVTFDLFGTRFGAGGILPEDTGQVG